MNGGGRYLVRLDDACETHDQKKWEEIEGILDRFGIKPIVAVIPCNADPSLRRHPENPDFWARVREWEKKGWAIALHGYRHLYHEVDKSQLVLPFHSRSEFAGLDFETQCDLLAKGYAEFVRNGILPTVWVAPGHSFDRLTLRALKHSTPIRIVSDGIAFYPFTDEGLTFVPQQLWWPKLRPFGIWTICLHPDTMTENQLLEFSRSLSKSHFWKRIVSIDEAVTKKKTRSLATALYERFFWLRWKLAQYKLRRNG